MEREILFRGKRKDNGKWVEGYLLKYSPIYEEATYILPFHSVCVADIEVDPKTICQHTGLTDKNGGKIFEGDIVNCQEKRGKAFWHCRVVWNDVWARFDVIAMGCSFPMCLDECDGDISINGSDYEVIGNIYDNPELLRGA